MLSRSALASAVVGLGLSLASASAGAQTIATFADPATGPHQPMFALDAATGILSGGWSLPGLTLMTPGGTPTSYSNVTFAMSPLTTVTNLSGVRFMSAGDVRFYDSSLAEIFRITFDGAVLTSAVSFGTSDFVGSNVAFSGSILPSGATISDEAFAFSFANPQSASPPGSFTVTSSFTSSATVIIPAPGAAGLIAGAGLLAARRRRR